MERPVKGISTPRRITRDKLHIEIAKLVSQRATCSRLSVGAVAVLDNRIVATGYNGPAEGQAHCNSFDCDTSKPCTRAYHAERNLLNWAIKNNLDLKNTHLYVTHQPCIDCAKLISFCGIKKVTYLYPYRLEDGLLHLKENQVEVTKYDEEDTTWELA